MSKNKNQFRSIFGLKERRVYTMTTSQYVVGFVISIGFSMIFGPLFERHAPKYLTAVSTAVTALKEADRFNPAEVARASSLNAAKKNAQKVMFDPYEKIRLQVRALKQGNESNS